MALVADTVNTCMKNFPVLVLPASGYNSTFVDASSIYRHDSHPKSVSWTHLRVQLALYALLQNTSFEVSTILLKILQIDPSIWSAFAVDQ